MACRRPCQSQITTGHAEPLAAQSGASLADLKARMGHDSDHAALIYQHATRDADRRIAEALDTRIKAERPDDDDGAAGVLVPVA